MVAHRLNLKPFFVGSVTVKASVKQIKLNQLQVLVFISEMDSHNNNNNK